MRARKSSRSGAETRARGFEPRVSEVNTDTTRDASSTGRPRNSAKSANAKPIVAAPMASASVATISAEVPGLRMQHAERRACKSPRRSNHMGVLLGYVRRSCGDSTEEITDGEPDGLLPDTTARDRVLAITLRGDRRECFRRVCRSATRAATTSRPFVAACPSETNDSGRVEGHDSLRISSRPLHSSSSALARSAQRLHAFGRDGESALRQAVTARIAAFGGPSHQLFRFETIERGVKRAARRLVAGRARHLAADLDRIRLRIASQNREQHSLFELAEKIRPMFDGLISLMATL